MHVKELDLFVTIKLLEDTLAVLSLGKLCEEHGYSYEWTSGQLPHLIKNDRKIQCKTENYVPIDVPGLSIGFFQFDHKYSYNIVIAGLSQFYIKSSKHTKSENERSSTGRPVARTIKNQKTKIMMMTSIWHREACCAICLSGWETSQGTSWMKVFWYPGAHPQALLANKTQNLREKWSRASTDFILTSRRTEIAKYAGEPHLQELLAGNAVVKPYLEQKVLVT